MLTKAKTQSKAAVKASFIVAEEVAKSACPFTKGEDARHCMLNVCDVMYPEKRQLFSNVSLTRNTTAECIQQLSTKLKDQLVAKGKDFIQYHIAVGESTNTSDMPSCQL